MEPKPMRIWFWVLLLAVVGGVPTLRAADVLERSYNRSRTGVNSAETVLTPVRKRL